MAAVSNDIAVRINNFFLQFPGRSVMILSGLQVAAAGLVPSSGSAPAGAQQGLRRLRAAVHTDVIRRDESRRTPANAPAKGVKSRTAGTAAIL
jgi:hypothetical protein